jgi:hypothetical protein
MSRWMPWASSSTWPPSPFAATPFGRRSSSTTATPRRRSWLLSSMMRATRRQLPPVVSTYPAAPTPDSSIVCELDSSSIDPGGDARTYARVWQLESAEGGVTDWSPEALDGENFGLPVVAGDTVSCIATADDGFDTTDSEPTVAVIEVCNGCLDSGCVVVTSDATAWTLDRLTPADGNLELLSDVMGFDASDTFIVRSGVTELTVYALGAGGGGRGTSPTAPLATSCSSSTTPHPTSSLASVRPLPMRRSPTRPPGTA